jgi:cytochrome c oxidase subunit 2
VKVVAATLALGACLSLVSGAAPAPGQDNPQVEVIEMTAKKYEYAPEEIRVKVGTRVQLKVRALDRSHGMKFKLYPKGEREQGPPGLAFPDGKNDFRLEQDDVVTIEFVAERPGEYDIECSVFCGFGHRGMDGKLIVEPIS